MMAKYSLIMLDNPIIVSDEEIKEGDWYSWYGNENNSPSLCIDSYNEDSIQYSKGFAKFYKVIAGLPKLPQIDWNGLESEFGYVDVEKLAKEETIRNQFNSEISFTQGFKKAQELNDKKFSLEDMKKAMRRAVIANWQDYSLIKTSNWIEDYIESISRPKSFKIEVEMEVWNHEGNVTSLSTLRPKITDGKIKIIKVFN